MKKSKVLIGAMLILSAMATTAYADDGKDLTQYPSKFDIDYVGEGSWESDEITTEDDTTEKIWYFNESDGRAIGWRWIDNYWYYFDETGKMYANQWILDQNNIWHYLNSAGDLAMDSWVQGKYYIDAYGNMLKNRYTPDGYYVGEDGAWIEDFNPEKASDYLSQVQDSSVDIYSLAHDYYDSHSGVSNTTSNSSGSSYSYYADDDYDDDYDDDDERTYSKSSKDDDEEELVSKEDFLNGRTGTVDEKRGSEPSSAEEKNGIYKGQAAPGSSGPIAGSYSDEEWNPDKDDDRKSSKNKYDDDDDDYDDDDEEDDED